MRRTIYCGAIAGAALAMSQAQPASAAPLTYDCDVPANNYSSITTAVALPVEISGTISPLVLRSGQFLPTASVNIFESDEAPGIGFQLVASSSRAKDLDIFFRNSRTPERRTPLGKIDLSGSVAFRLTLPATGQGTLLIGERAFTFEAEPLSSATLLVSCSTGQFKFIDLDWASGTAPSSNP